MNYVRVILFLQRTRILMCSYGDVNVCPKNEKRVNYLNFRMFTLPLVVA